MLAVVLKMVGNMNILKRKHFMQLALSNKLRVGKLRRVKWSSKRHGATCSDPIAQSSLGGSISRCHFPSDVIDITVTLSSFITGRLSERQLLLGLC